MNEFVEECREHWKRLGVPDPVANEMAADLEADLEEAEGEGVSPEEVLGSGAFDPRSFAASWAAERGVAHRRPPSASGHQRRFPPAAIGAFTLVAIVGALLVILFAPSSPDRLAFVVGPPPGASAVKVLPPVVVTPDGVGRTVLPPAAAIDVDDSGVDTHAVGSVLLIVGLAGIVLLTLFWLWFGPGSRSPRGAYFDDPPPGSAY